MASGKPCPTCGTCIPRAADSALPPTERAVLATYRSLAQEDPTAPIKLGVTELGRLVQRAPGTVRRARTALATAGFLVKVDYGGGPDCAAFLIVD